MRARRESRPERGPRSVVLHHDHRQAHVRELSQRYGRSDGSVQPRRCIREVAETEGQTIHHRQSVTRWRHTHAGLRETLRWSRRRAGQVPGQDRTGQNSSTERITRRSSARRSSAACADVAIAEDPGVARASRPAVVQQPARRRLVVSVSLLHPAPVTAAVRK